MMQNQTDTRTALGCLALLLWFAFMAGAGFMWLAYTVLR